MHHSFMLSLSLLFIIMLLPQLECLKSGNCPSNQNAVMMVCGKLCDGDESCPGTQKCVIFKLILNMYYINKNLINLFIKCDLNGCFFDCVEPFVKKQCPDKVNQISLCSVANNCSDDTECSESQACCSLDCGKKCINF